MTYPQVTIVVLAKYLDVYLPFIESLRRYKVDAPVVCVVDGSTPDPMEKWQGSLNPQVFLLTGPDKFSMAGNGNMGLKAVTEGDILYCGDDIRFLEPRTIERLQEIAYKDDKIGILSPRLIGRGSPTQVNPKDEITEVKPLEMWFPCVYIKREVIDKIGYLDELFNDFGSDDLDYCIRTKMEGYKLAVTSKVAVKHEASPEGGPTTFCKNIGVQKYQQQQHEAFMKLRKKYGTSPVVFDKFLLSGDTNLLTKNNVSAERDFDEAISEGMLCDVKDAEEFLKTRHLFIATPMYGGWASINYINSLVSLINECQNRGIRYTVSFMHNESLITRARNKMADGFMKTDATDFFFIDADIGFEAKDILTLMWRSEDVIGIPCARKNLRLDRVVAAVKKNGREYNIDELEDLLGEVVMNFPHDAVPQTIDVSRMQEVQEVGTGLMRVRRDTFTKFMEAYPDRWYLQMVGETDGSRLPMYMFFQAGFDEATRKINPESYPDYISEDYWFCREARRAGMKVWIAPWCKTTHMGSYMFKADMLAMGRAGGALR